jgi:hypothetical protein
MSAPGLRRVAEVLSWYGEATTDQLAVELGLRHDERPSLEAALEFWVRRGDARLERRLPLRGAKRGGARAPGGCAGGCCAQAPEARGTLQTARGAAAARVWVWTATA